MSNSPRIDADFANLIPPLREDEYAALEQSLIAEGCRDALVVWGEEKILLDGHNRLIICYEHGIPFNTLSLNLPSREAAQRWILDNQLARRNLTDKQRKLLMGLRYKAEKATWGTNQHTRSDHFGHSSTSKTRKQIADELGVGEGTIQRAEVFADAVEVIAVISPELANALITEEVEATYREIARFADVCQQEPESAGEAADDILSGNEHSLTWAVRRAQPDRKPRSSPVSRRETCSYCGQELPDQMLDN